MNTARLFIPICLFASTAWADLGGTYTASSVRLTMTQTDSQVEGTLKINDKSFPVTGTVRDEAAACVVRDGGNSFAFTAKPTADGIEIVSEGIKVRLTREGGNPLAAIRTPAVASADEVTAEVAAKLPSISTHSLGFSVRHPANWKKQDSNGGFALVPDDAPQLQGGAGEVHALAAMPKPAEVGDLVERMRQEVAKSLPRFEQDGAAEVSGPESRRIVALRYSTVNEGQAYRATLRAAIRGELIIVMLSLGTADAIQNHDAMATEVFSSVAAAERVLDQQIVGSWTNSSSYSSAGFSMASSRTYILRADGTYSYTSRTAGGTADVSADSGGSSEAGVWAAADGKLTLLDAAGNASVLSYHLVDGTLVAVNAAGKRTLWSR